ncbi:MAG: hypothetical protein ABSH20_05650 [Tepidisphaeraceae bacterium]|jgi:hypothetical protein
MLVALAVALGLYFTIGQNSKEVPAWITLPPGASVQASESAPEDQADGGVRYYLRFKMPGDVATALTQFTSGIRETKWEVAAPRVATRDDLGVRGSWPEWVKKQMHRVPDVSAGRAMSGSASGERLYAYAWPTKEACVVELVVMGTARGPAAPAKAKPVEE